ncbi:MAG: FIG01057682: hypothetical protein [uncultured Thiotrichaceae bacterium]|uniref:PhoD-like phosphatase metallophosphatase domain-containing protein n=1 Tax=uncultured Thiotrichaceae bacterium TaxID=298394 RepID=A0A6S6UI72_9GAMM|nr:MAG: FIG01057682: hypothetical protein [uncultured Thiotrichaceae bacterium]
MHKLPDILAGPIVRYATADELIIWLVTSAKIDLQLQFFHDDACVAEADFAAGHPECVQVGKHAFIQRLHLKPEIPLPKDQWLNYDIGLNTDAGTLRWLADTAPHLSYKGQQRPGFVIKSTIDQMLHGSCRKPHFKGDDGMWLVDDVLAEVHNSSSNPEYLQPALLLLSGDQIYADEVAGPMLTAIHQVINLLGLQGEQLEDALVSSSDELYKHELNYYRRMELLPNRGVNVPLRERFFGGVRKPIFTTTNADNHLITLAEVIAMYLLVWSPTLWRFVDLDKVSLKPELRQRYQGECEAIQHFSQGLDKVQRAMANVPVQMIFDDHDVTDDWNLTRAWEESAYEHAFSKRIIGNALIGYALCQGWGNTPDALPEDMLHEIKKLYGMDDKHQHDELIKNMLKYEGWQYTLPTSPKIVVLDTRTRRWRSERDSAQPSGLMDWESLSETQQELINESAVILVSPAPIFGVKLIEVVQRVFTWLGFALTVDAENWMAHPGAANVILNIFRHKRTPHHFVILSGDVHYSFVYDVKLKHREHSPHIWQIGSSGIKNMFPVTLLRVFDTLNRWLFASYSPLNWFTRRRYFRIRQRRPGNYSGRYPHQRLVNGCTIGLVKLDKEGAPVVIAALMSNGERIMFSKGYESDWMD